MATPTSHTAILSRLMNWPSISGVEIKDEWHDKEAIVDGINGLIIIEPDRVTMQEYQSKQQIEKEKVRELLSSYKGRRSVTKDGHELLLFANIASTNDIDKVLENDAEGIGNYKTEFLYLNRNAYPSEEEMFNTYKKAAERMGCKKTIIRTFDIGADKTADYFHLDREENPALGYRAIRIGLDRPDVLKTQIRAIVRASAFGSVSIMYPMVVSVDELIRLKSLTGEVMEELKREGVPFDESIEQGIMIETPAAVFMSDELAKVADFFSIGTNDLTQYMLAADRQNAKLQTIYNPYHPSIMRAIQHVVINAHRAGIWVEISGELSFDFNMTKKFIDSGVDALAVPPARILPLRKHILEI